MNCTQQHSMQSYSPMVGQFGGLVKVDSLLLIMPPVYPDRPPSASGFPSLPSGAGRRYSTGSILRCPARPPARLSIPAGKRIRTSANARASRSSRCPSSVPGRPSRCRSNPGRGGATARLGSGLGGNGLTNSSHQRGCQGGIGRVRLFPGVGGPGGSARRTHVGVGRFGRYFQNRRAPGADVLAAPTSDLTPMPWSRRLHSQCSLEIPSLQ